MRVKVLGVEKVDYISKRTGEPVKGIALHSVYKDTNVLGETVERIFVSDRMDIAAVSEVKPGITVDINYNRRGSVDSVAICK
ncbi:MAG: hypothetical protein Q4C69_12485 [Lachnoclostridium edouardi]|uniref:hypothetical protein n=1 Tax=Lachnoclostridium edouardi TaxID=1926283 RepID=UPI0026DB401B|nr:hypothetical protein [Lachnoclostridium edouardi]MDO4279637.1 hypothetical protein [Lachnoclostridium edouardi]